MIGSRNNFLSLLAAAAVVTTPLSFITTVEGRRGGGGLGKSRQLQDGGTPTFAPTTTFKPTGMPTTSSPTATYRPTAMETTESPTTTFPPTMMATDPTAAPTSTYAPTAMDTTPTSSPTSTYPPTSVGTSIITTVTDPAEESPTDMSPVQEFTTDDTYSVATQADMTSLNCPSTGGEVYSGLSCEGLIPLPYQYHNCLYATKKCVCRNDAPQYLCTSA